MANINATWDTLAGLPGGIEDYENCFCDAVEIFKGALVITSATGYMTHGANTVARYFLGINMEYFDNSGGAAGDMAKPRLRNGKHLFKMAGATQADICEEVYIGADEDTVTLTAGNGLKCGKITDVCSDTKGTKATSGGYVYIDITGYC